MRDRNPRYPGRVRLMPVDEENHIYDLERADEPTQQGTPLDKNTLLRDETVARFGGNSDMTVDAAINAIMDELGLKIGDVVQTTGDVPDGWLPMDGTEIDPDVYPELYKLRAYNGRVGVRASFNGVTDSNARNQLWLKKVNDYYVGMAYGTLFYQPVSGGTWKKRSLTSALLETNHKLGYTDIEWDDVNNQWLLAAGMKATSSDTSSVSRCKLFTLVNLDATPVKIKDEQNYSGGETPVYIHKEGQYFVLNDNAYDNATAMNWRAKTYIATDPNGTWTDLSTLTIGTLRYVNSVKYADRRYIVGGDINETDTQSPAFAYTGQGEDLTNATWTTKKVADGVASGTPARYIVVNNIVWMPKSNAYLFSCGEQGVGSTESKYYRRSLTGMTHALSAALGSTTPETLYTDGILYTQSGAYKDEATNTGSPFDIAYTDSLAEPEKMTEDGLIASVNSSGTLLVMACIKTLPDLGADDGLIYKIKAKGAIFTGDDDPGYTPDWSDIDFEDPNNDGNIVITIGGN